MKELEGSFQLTKTKLYLTPLKYDVHDYKAEKSGYFLLFLMVRKLTVRNCGG